MSIRNRIANTRAPKKQRAPVTAQSHAHAEHIKKSWSIEDALRDMNAKVLAVADNMDEALSDAAAAVVRTHARKAVAAGVADAMAEARTAATEEAEINRAQDRERERCVQAHNAQVVTLFAEYRAARAEAYAEAVVRCERAKNENLYQFPSALAEKDHAAYGKRLEKLDHEGFFALVKSEFLKANDDAWGMIHEQLKANRKVLDAQLTAIDRGEDVPEPEDVPGLITVFKDGTVKRT